MKIFPNRAHHDLNQALFSDRLQVVESIPFFTHWDAYYMSSWPIMPQTGEMAFAFLLREEALFLLLYGGEAGARTLDSFIVQNDVRYFVLDERYLDKKYVSLRADGGMTGLFLQRVKAIVQEFNREGVFPWMAAAKQCTLAQAGPVYFVAADD